MGRVLADPCSIGSASAILAPFSPAASEASSPAARASRGRRERADPRRLDRRRRREQRDRRSAARAAGSTTSREHRPAVAPLAASHPGPRRALDRADVLDVVVAARPRSRRARRSRSGTAASSLVGELSCQVGARRRAPRARPGSGAPSRARAVLAARPAREARARRDPEAPHDVDAPRSCRGPGRRARLQRRRRRRSPRRVDRGAAARVVLDDELALRLVEAVTAAGGARELARRRNP